MHDISGISADTFLLKDAAKWKKKKKKKSVLFVPATKKKYVFWTAFQNHFVLRMPSGTQSRAVTGEFCYHLLADRNS